MQALPQFSTRNSSGRFILRKLINREITSLLMAIYHFLKGYDFDPYFLLMLQSQFLRSIRRIKQFTRTVFAGASMIAADNKMRAPIIFTDNRMPYCFTGATHAHSKWQ